MIKKYKAAPSIQHGRVMKEYVQVPESLLENTKVLAGYLWKSYEYAKGLKPKAN